MEVDSIQVLNEMYADLSTDYHYDVENKSQYEPPKSLLSLYLEAHDLSSILGPVQTEISASQLFSAILKAAWKSLQKESDLADITEEDEAHLIKFFKASQLVILIDNLEFVPYESNGNSLELTLKLNTSFRHSCAVQLSSATTEASIAQLQRREPRGEIFLLSYRLWH